MNPWRFAAPGRFAVGSLFAGVLLALSLFAAAATATAEASLQSLEFVTESGPHVFQVEVADTSDERAKGLMFRRAMPENQGMLFDFHTETPVLMWMKNTYIPLDMIFISKKGTVAKIVADTTPMSEAIIDGGRAYAVVELNAGAAKKIGLKPGDSVRHAAFKN